MTSPAPGDPRIRGNAKIPVQSCLGCSKDHQPVRRNQKLCRPCRLLRDFDYWNESMVKPAKCEICEGKFLRTSRNDKACAKCNPGLANTALMQCLSCGSSDQGLERAHTPICRVCARWGGDGWRDLRADVRRALRDWLHEDDPYAYLHPQHRAVLKAADAAASRLGIGREDALHAAKVAMGLAPGAGTTDFKTLTSHLEVL